MGKWLERYESGQRAQVWMEMTSIGPGLRGDAEFWPDAVAVARVTMQRARTNVELLVDALPALGFEFECEPFVPSTDSTVAELDRLESQVGVLPLSLRIWFEEVGLVNLNGRHAGWSFDYPDPLVVDAPVDLILSEHETWLGDRGTEWDQGPAFELGLAPDYLHKANVSGGPPYAMQVPNEAADGLLLWEPHQTTFVNYLRIAFSMGGMPGWRREPAVLDQWALPEGAPPDDLLEVARQLQPV